MDLWATEYFIAMAGNGIDAYNSYRRNGFPSDIQPNIEPDPGSFPLSMFYPSDYTSSSSNAKQKSDVNERVFWNTNGPTNLKLNEHEKYINIYSFSRWNSGMQRPR